MVTHYKPKFQYISRNETPMKKGVGKQVSEAGCGLAGCGCLIIVLGPLALLVVAVCVAMVL